MIKEIMDLSIQTVLQLVSQLFLEYMKKTIIQYKDEEPPGITFFSLNPSKKKQQKPIKNLSFLDEEQKQIGPFILQTMMECLFVWTAWFHKNSNQTKTKFFIAYQECLKQGVCFPEYEKFQQFERQEILKNDGQNGLNLVIYMEELIDMQIQVQQSKDYLNQIIQMADESQLIVENFNNCYVFYEDYAKTFQEINTEILFKEDKENFCADFEYVKQIMNLMKRYQNKKIKFEEFKTKTALLLDILVEKNKQNNTQNVNYKEKSENLQKEIEKVSKQNEQIQKDYQNSLLENQRIVKQNENLLKENESLKTSFKNEQILNENNFKLQKENESLKKEAEEAKQLQENSQKELENIQIQNEYLQKNQEELQKQIDKNNEFQLNLEAQIEQITQEKQSIQKQSQQNNDQLKQQLENQQKQIQKYQLQIFNFKKKIDNENHKERNVLQQQNQNDCDNQYNGENENVKRTKQEHYSEEEDLFKNGVQLENIKLTEMNEELGNLNNELLKKLNFLEQKLDQIQQNEAYQQQKIKQYEQTTANQQKLIGTQQQKINQFENQNQQKEIDSSLQKTIDKSLNLDQKIAEFLEKKRQVTQSKLVRKREENNQLLNNEILSVSKNSHRTRLSQLLFLQQNKSTVNNPLEGIYLPEFYLGVNENPSFFQSKKTKILQNELIFPFQSARQYYQNKKIRQKQKGTLVLFSESLFLNYANFNDLILDKFKLANLKFQMLLYTNQYLNIAQITSFDVVDQQKYIIKLGLYFQNKSNSCLNNFNINLQHNETVVVWKEPNSIKQHTLINNEFQLKQCITIHFNQIPYNIPLVEIEYLQGHHLKIPLPCLITKFMEIQEIPNIENFKEFWIEITSNKTRFLRTKIYQCNQQIVENHMQMMAYFPLFLHLNVHKNNQFEQDLGDFKIGGKMFLRQFNCIIGLKICLKPGYDIEFQVACVDQNIGEYFIQTLLFIFTNQ